MDKSLIVKLAIGFVSAGLGAGATLLLTSGDSGPKVKPKLESERAPAPHETKPATPAPSGPVRRQLVDSRSRALEFEQLEALGYVDGTYDPESELSDVVVHVRAKTAQGYNFYASRKQRGAQLIDMDGRTVHEWSTQERGEWQHVELMPNGDVLVIVQDERLSRYDKDSNLVWSVRGRPHHDLWVHEGQIYVLWRAPEVVEHIHPRVATLVDFIQVRSLRDGSLIREVSILEAIAKSPYSFLLPSIAHQKRSKKRGALDVLHTNHIEVFDGWLAHRYPIYATGNILISMRNINAIAILHSDTFDVLWLWGPTNLTFQHHPALLRNGNILLFDNGLKRSRVVEMDPLAGRIEWQYAPRSGFFSRNRGSIQRLPNGNTLITESDRGYVHEITPDQTVVWKFANPVINKKQEREAIWRMKRFTPESLTFLN